MRSNAHSTRSLAFLLTTYALSAFTKAASHFAGAADGANCVIIHTILKQHADVIAAK
jgi:hypothetical protein